MAKNAQIATTLLTSCDNFLQQGDIRMCSACDSLLTTSLLQVVNGDLLPFDCPNLLSAGFCKLFQH